MPGQLPDETKRRQHDQLVQSVPSDLKGVLDSTRKFEENFREIHMHAERIARTAFEPVGQHARKMQPSHLVEHIDAVHAHSQDLARSTMPNVQRHVMSEQQVQSQHEGIASMRSLVEENINHLADIRRHLDELHKKLTRLEEMYRS